MLFYDWFVATASTFALISLAEIGDKSQLVCMTLAARHRPWPVLSGAVIAFALLNLLAVLFGAGVAAWIPEHITAAIVSVLFAAFGIHALRAVDDDGEDIRERGHHGILLTTLALILVAEFGDKTQIAVAGLASTLPALPVWAGATLALATVSALGVWAGSTLLKRLPTHWMHRAGGAMFLLFSLLAAWRAISVWD
ncbi:MAG: TMEM165/GDT1 family protein [Thiogranum sp.]|jgi:putative Ca2+/H+ antiporter (TMEM165/GDT1 family)